MKTRNFMAGIFAIAFALSSAAAIAQAEAVAAQARRDGRWPQP